jgi:outer membrane biosynthesis protein TonB
VNASPALPGGAAPPHGGAGSIASPALPGGAAPHGGAGSIDPEHAQPPVPEPTPEPVPVQPQVPKPQPVPTPPEPAKPTRTPVVAATAVSKVSGELPVMRGDHDGDVLVKMCIDDSGKVTSAKIVKTSPDMPSDLVGALQQWRYKPYLKDGKPQPVCFALSLRVVVKNDN